MPAFQTTSSPTAEIYFQDCGTGDPVVLIHGWPLSHRMWEYQVNALTEAGYRCLAYDRRGFGESSMPWGGYDYDTMAADLNDLLVKLDLRDVTLVGFSMGGGEVARYVGRFGTDRLRRIAFVSAVTPFMLKTDDNPDGVPQDTFDEMMAGVKNDRIQFLDGFGRDFVNFDDLGGDRISEDLLVYNKHIASFAQPYATQQCITAFSATDFRDDLRKADVPALFVHGDADQIVPLEVSAKKAAPLVDDSRLEVIEGAPHGLNYTHTEELNELLLDFLGS